MLLDLSHNCFFCFIGPCNKVKHRYEMSLIVSCLFRQRHTSSVTPLFGAALVVEPDGTNENDGDAS